MMFAKCPHCDYSNQIESHHYPETDTIYTYECDHCDEVFSFSYLIIYEVHSGPAPCANNKEPHKWEPIWVTTPPCYECKVCGERKEMRGI